MSPRALQQDWVFLSTERQEKRKLLSSGGGGELFNLADHVSLLDQSNGLRMPDDWIKPQFLNHSSVNGEENEGVTIHIFA